MEKGKLQIIETRKGFAAKIIFTRADGRTSELPITQWRPTKDHLKYNGTDCSFQRNGGQLLKLISHDGATLFGTQIPAVRSPIDTKYKVKLPDSYDPGLARLPSDTKQVLSGLISPDNFYLKLHKAARFEGSQSSDASRHKFKFYNKDRQGNNYSISENYGDIDFTQITQRAFLDAQKLLGDNLAQKFELKTTWRMVQGLGSGSVYEISMTLHHIYGIPYLPASSLKGITRSWIITEYFNSDESAALNHRTFCDWFGGPSESIYEEARRGRIVFFDVFPTSAPEIVVDVMNPHYQPYYSDSSGRTAPADYHQPIPIFFLTLADTSFQIIFGGLSQAVMVGQIGNKTVAHWIKDALINHGIGAKTAVGYGYLTDV